MSKKQTAVEWLMEQISYENGYGERNNTFTNQKDLTEFFQQALAIEREQIVEAYQSDRTPCSDEDAKQYYKETYGKESEK